MTASLRVDVKVSVRVRIRVEVNFRVRIMLGTVMGIELRLSCNDEDYFSCTDAKPDIKSNLPIFSAT